MATLVSPATLREHLETDLKDPALQRLLDDADAAIIDRYGPHAGNVTVDQEGASRLLFLDRPATVIVSVNEYTIRDDSVPVLLAADDYRALYNSHALERLTTGTHARTLWGERIVIVYTPTDENARRTLIEIDLAKLAAKMEIGITLESVGDYQARFADYTMEYERILRRLARRRLPFA